MNHEGKRERDPSTKPEHRRQLVREGISTLVMRGWVAMLAGLPFLGVAAACLLVVGGVLELPDIPKYARVLIAEMGGLFACAGLFLLLGGMRKTVQSVQRKQGRLRAPQQPWIWDYRWDTRCAHGRLLSNCVKAALFSAVLAGILVPINLWAVGDPFFVVFAGLLDLVWLLSLVVFVNHLRRLHRFGRSTLIFAEFPFHLGQDLRATLAQAGRLQDCHSLQLTLRCIEEVSETVGRGRNQSTKVVCYALYEDCQVLQPESLRLTPGSQLSISFPLPLDAPPTRRSEQPPRYWELEIEAGFPGVDFKEQFLVPVY